LPHRGCTCDDYCRHRINPLRNRVGMRTERGRPSAF
jgi:hypothetical protein